MQIKQIPIGIFVGAGTKREIIAVKLTNEKGNYVKILNYGAIIQRFVVKNAKGILQDIVLGFDTIEQYISDGYLLITRI